MRTAALCLLLAALTCTLRAADAELPATRPAPGQVSVLISPFVPLGDAGTSAWMGEAIQQNILNELTRQQMLHAITTPKNHPIPADAPAASAAARASGVQFALYGTFQVAEGNLRVMGQVVDAHTGKHIGAIKATGSTRDLFLIEDTLSEQARRLLLAQAIAPAAVAPLPPIQAQGAQPQVIIIQMPAPQAPPQPPAADPVLPIVFPWNRDRGDLDNARRQLVIDDDLDAAFDRRLRYFSTYSSGYFGYYPTWYSSGSRYHCHRPGVTYFPGGVVRGSFRPIPGGIINVNWRW